MSLFTVTTKLWPTGASLDTGTDNNVVTIPPGSASFDRHAANFVTSVDGSQNYQFLFWNTGRHITNKRHVHWDFSVGGWGVWSATKWYGTPGTGPGKAEVRVDPFSIGGNAPITGSGTAIADPPASTFPAGAFPDMGDDHLISTANGAIDVAAKDPFASLQFAGWDLLVFGGDDTGEFDESDSGAAQGSSGFYPVGSGTYHVAQGGGASLLALYGNSNRLHIGSILGKLSQVNFNPGIITIPDPSPEDRLRLAILETYLQQTQPGARQNSEFEILARNAPRMSVEELKESLKSLQMTLSLGNTAAAAVLAQIKAKTGA